MKSMMMKSMIMKSIAMIRDKEKGGSPFLSLSKWEIWPIQSGRLAYAHSQMKSLLNVYSK